MGFEELENTLAARSTVGQSPNDKTNGRRFQERYSKEEKERLTSCGQIRPPPRRLWCELLLVRNAEPHRRRRARLLRHKWLHAATHVVVQASRLRTKPTEAHARRLGLQLLLRHCCTLRLERRGKEGVETRRLRELLRRQLPEGTREAGLLVLEGRELLCSGRVGKGRLHLRLPVLVACLLGHELVGLGEALLREAGHHRHHGLLHLLLLLLHLLRILLLQTLLVDLLQALPRGRDLLLVASHLRLDRRWCERARLR